jgi:hypothetical protein
LNWGIQIDQKGPVKTTLSVMIRWIFGLCFILIALGMIIVREYLSAGFMLMVIFVSFPPISNLIDSELNISMSGPVRFLLVLILLAGSFSVEPNYSSSVITDAQIFLGFHSITQMKMFVIGIGNDILYLI